MIRIEYKLQQFVKAKELVNAAYEQELKNYRIHKIPINREIETLHELYKTINLKEGLKND